MNIEQNKKHGDGDVNNNIILSLKTKFINFATEIETLEKIFIENKVCESHGLEHALIVMNHASKALECIDNVTEHNKSLVLLASLLHDADDRKYFPNHKNYENARVILNNNNNKYKQSDIEQIIRMISLVSASKNGDTIPTTTTTTTTNDKDDDLDINLLLVPRYSDRLEAMGLIGVWRCYLYNKTSNDKRPLYIKDQTPIPKNLDDLWKNIATEARYKSYSGCSLSMIDHYYDKLLRLSLAFPIRNKYFDAQCAERLKPLTDFVMFFAESIISGKSFNDVVIENFIKNYHVCLD